MTCGIVGDRGRRALGDHAALVQHVDALGERGHGLHDVLDQQDGDARVADVADDLDDLGDLGRIEAGHHLVEQQQARPGGERAGELQALAAGDGEVGAHLVELVRHADLPATASASRSRQLAVGGAEIGADHDVLAHADLGERLGDLEGAHHAGGADPVRRQAGDVLAVEGDAAGIGRLEAGDGGEQRRLAGAVGPDQADDLALPHVERGLVDGLQAAERLGELAHLKHGAAFVRNRPISPSGRRATISTSMMP